MLIVLLKCGHFVVNFFRFVLDRCCFNSTARFTELSNIYCVWSCFSLIVHSTLDIDKDECHGREQERRMYSGRR